MVFATIKLNENESDKIHPKKRYIILYYLFVNIQYNSYFLLYYIIIHFRKVGDITDTTDTTDTVQTLRKKRKIKYYSKRSKSF